MGAQSIFKLEGRQVIDYYKSGLNLGFQVELRFPSTVHVSTEKVAE
jgi:hypothetical protein